MIWLFLLCLALVCFLLQRTWAERVLAWLRYEKRCSQTLAEVGEPVAVTARLENHGPLPIIFIHTQEFFPPEATIHEDPRWMEDHMHERLGDQCVDEKLFLMPHQRRTTTVHVSFPRRGWYPLRGSQISTGDFFGLENASRREAPAGEVVVMPPRYRDTDLTNTLGGFLGDISVRRFILEDPVLTTGFREYTGREPMKSISWPQSARCGHLVVKQYDHTVDLSVTVLLNAEGGTSGQLEQCFSMTRTVCETLESKGIPYDLRTNADLIGPMGTLHHISQGLGRRHLNTILYGLGRSFCRCVQPLDELVGQCRAAQNANRSYVVVSPPLSGEQRLALQTLRAGGVAMTIFIGEEEDQ